MRAAFAAGPSRSNAGALGWEQPPCHVAGRGAKLPPDCHLRRSRGRGGGPCADPADEDCRIGKKLPAQPARSGGGAAAGQKGSRRWSRGAAGGTPTGQIAPRARRKLPPSTPATCAGDQPRRSRPSAIW